MASFLALEARWFLVPKLGVVFGFADNDRAIAASQQINLSGRVVVREEFKF